MGPSIHQRGRGPYGEFLHQRQEGKQDQGLHMYLRLRYHSRCSSRSRRKSEYHVFHHVSMTPRRLEGSTFYDTIR